MSDVDIFRELLGPVRLGATDRDKLVLRRQSIFRVMRIRVFAPRLEQLRLRSIRANGLLQMEDFIRDVGLPAKLFDHVFDVKIDTVTPGQEVEFYFENVGLAEMSVEVYVEGAEIL